MSLKEIDVGLILRQEFLRLLAEEETIRLSEQEKLDGQVHPKKLLRWASSVIAEISFSDKNRKNVIDNTLFVLKILNSELEQQLSSLILVNDKKSDNTLFEQSQFTDPNISFK